MNRIKRHLYTLIIHASAAFLLLLPSKALSGTTVPGGTIATDTTWTLAGSPYTVTGTITVQGTDGSDGITTLTIEPGVTVYFNYNTSLNIGGVSGSPGALRAIGSSTSPITFTPQNQTYRWGGIYFQKTADSATSILDNCIVEKAANYNIQTDTASPVIRNSTIRNSNYYGLSISNGSPSLTGNTIAANSGYGINITNGSPVLSGNTISNNTSYGIYCTDTASRPQITGNTITGNGSYPMHIGANLVYGTNTITGNTNQAIELLGDTITLDNTWKNIGCSYIVTSTITVQGTDGSDGKTTLTIEPGVAVYFSNNASLKVGGISGNPGALIAVGTSASPITFTTQNQTYRWAGISFQKTADSATCILDHCIVEKAANYNIQTDTASPVIRNSIIRNSNYYGLSISNGSPSLTGNTITANSAYGINITNGSPLLSGNTISNNSTYGIYCADTASRPQITGNTITGNGSYPMHIGANLVYGTNTITGNTNQTIELLGDTITLNNTWKNIGCSYIVTGTITVQGTDGSDGKTTLTIEPGVTVYFGYNMSLKIGGFSGSPGALVAVGTAASPITFTTLNQTNRWSGICFQQTADSATSVLDSCVVEKTSANAIQINSTSPTIQNSIIRNNASTGIYINGGSPKLTGNTISDNTSYGIYIGGPGNENIVVQCNTIMNNPTGIMNTASVPLSFSFNNIFNSSSYAVNSSSAKLTVINNWWGSILGSGCTGGKINGNVDSKPFLMFKNSCDANSQFVDTDHDGLPDTWEMQYFGNLNQSGEGDYDDDGLSNWTEYMLGTNPCGTDNIQLNKLKFEYDAAGRINKITIMPQ